jgi:hypothetical protein
MAHAHVNEPRQILSVSRHGCQHYGMSYDNLRVNRVLRPTEKRGWCGKEKRVPVPEAKAGGGEIQI